MPRLPYRKGFQPLHGRTPRLRLDHLRQVTRRKLLRLRIKCLPAGSAAVHLGLALRRRQQAPREIVCMRLLLPNGGGGGLPACAAPSRYARRSPKNKVGLCLIKVRPCFLGKPPCFSKVPVCFAALALGLRPCPAVCSARVCLLRALSPAGAAVCVRRGSRWPDDRPASP